MLTLWGNHSPTRSPVVGCQLVELVGIASLQVARYSSMNYVTSQDDSMLGLLDDSEDIVLGH